MGGVGGYERGEIQMFIWDFVADTVLGQIVDWIYGQIVGFLGDFFMQIGNMGADLFEMSWVQSIVLFFSYLAWASPAARSPFPSGPANGYEIPPGPIPTT